MKSFREAAMWGIVLDLRCGKSWTAASQAIMTDEAFLQDCLNNKTRLLSANRKSEHAEGNAQPTGERNSFIFG